MTVTIPTAKWDLSGIHGIRQWIWGILQAELGWKKTEYGGLVPITTPAQQPELNNYSGPYLVYNYAQQTGGEDFWITEEQAAFAVYSQTEEDIRRVLNVISAYLNRRDQSAQELNDYLKSLNNPFYKDIDYKYTYVLSTSGANAPTQEGGRQDGLFILRYAYVFSEPGVASVTLPGRERIDSGVQADGDIGYLGSNENAALVVS